ncbi:MAG: GIY-YIG nuclease family protein [Deltaproteobacteria bacterium]|nr:GIY-YIG nuclease family protein [Deltaproteobacteria bacterium]
MDKQFCVYTLASKRNGTLYIGVNSQLATRVWQHKSKVVEGFSAKYGVDKLVYYEAQGCAETAIVRGEAAEEVAPRAWKMTNCVPFGHGPRPDSTRYCQTGEDLPGRLHVTHRFVAHPCSAAVLQRAGLVPHRMISYLLIGSDEGRNGDEKHEATRDKW